MSASLTFDPASGTSVLYGGNERAGRRPGRDLGLGRAPAGRRLAGRGPEPDPLAGRDGRRIRATARAGPLRRPPGGRTSDLPPALGDTWDWDRRDAGSARVDAAGPGDLVNAAGAGPSPGSGPARRRLRPRTDRPATCGTGTATGGCRWRSDVFPPRQAFGLAYDEARDVVVLTGGIVQPGSLERHQDVWEWSGDPQEKAVRVDARSPGLSSRRAATPRASRRRPAPGGRHGRAARSASRRCSISCALMAPPSSSRARSTMVIACRPRPARSRQRPGMPGGAVTGRGCRRFISSSATSGRQRATSSAASRLAASRSAERSSRSASPTSASGRGSGRERLPDDRGSDPRRHQPETAPGDHDRLAGLEGRGVERRRDRPARPGPRAPGRRTRSRSHRRARSAASAASEGDRAVLAGQPGDRVRGVVADHRVQHEVRHRRRRAATPCPTRRARRRRAGRWSRRPRIRRRRSPSRALGFASCPPSSSSPT